MLDTAFVKEFLIPGSPWFLLLGITTCTLVLMLGSPAARRLSTGLLALLVGLYWLISLPVMTAWLATGNWRGLPSDPVIGSNAVDAVVVLANGVYRFKVGDTEVDTLPAETAFTVVEAVRVYKRVGAPTMIVSGGVSRPEAFRHSEAEILRNALLAQGIPEADIVLEDRSGTTQEQAANTAAIMRERGVTRLAVVTSPIHMPRALAAFKAQGVDAHPAPSAFGTNARNSVRSRWRPTTSGWLMGERAVYEALGRTYYWLRGWAVETDD